MKHEIETIRYAVVVILAAVILALMVWTLAAADGPTRTSPPECPPGLDCEPYPPPPYPPAPPRPAPPAFLPFAAGEAYPAP